MVERTLRGVMADAGVSQSELAVGINMARQTLNYKIRTGGFDCRDIRAICGFLNLTDAELICDVFSLRKPLQNQDGEGGVEDAGENVQPERDRRDVRGFSEDGQAIYARNGV